MTDNDDLGTRAGVARMAEEQADEMRRLGEAKEGEVVYVADINAPHLQQREVAQLTLVEKLTEMRERIVARIPETQKECAEAGLDYARLRFARDDANDIAALDAAIAVIEEATAPKPVALG